MDESIRLGLVYLQLAGFAHGHPVHGTEAAAQCLAARGPLCAIRRVFVYERVLILAGEISFPAGSGFLLYR
ncbi:hypothetical protein D3C71_2163500 [compost metagenome]